MSARDRREKRGEATRRLQAAARRLDGSFLIAPEGATPYALFGVGPQLELVVIYLGQARRYRAWLRNAGDQDRSRQELFGDVKTEADLGELVAAGRERFA